MGPFCNIQSYDDIDDFSERVTWDLDLKQLSAGKFRADLISFGDVDIQIGETVYNKTLLQHGSVPDGFTFAVNHPDSAPIIWRHLDFPANGIIVFPESNEHQGISQPHHHPFTVTISETFLYTVAGEIGLPDVDQFIIRGEVRLCEPASIQPIQRLLGELCNQLKHKGAACVETLLRHAMKWNITRLFLLALATSIQFLPRKRNFSKRKQIAGRVMRYVEDGLTISHSIPELCNVAGVDERTLRNIFYEQFFLSPMKYLKYHRLNAVRSALKEIDSPNRSIADIANDNGFWHMGQFASDYKLLFGELPSQTLKRKVNSHRSLN
jgi:AraC family ethanolamine operon transcriptional activator